MKKLLNGILEFRQKRLPDYRETFAKLALGQKPDALFIACSDSRVVPNLFASTDPGDLFVVRNVGNFVPKPDSEASVSEGAAIEFSVNALGVKDIIVCGHSECGAAKAMLESVPTWPHLGRWLQEGRPTLEALKAGKAPDSTLAEYDQFSQLNTLVQMEHLLGYPEIAQRVKEGSLHLHAWWFDVRTAEVYGYRPDLRRFALLGE